MNTKLNAVPTVQNLSYLPDSLKKAFQAFDQSFSNVEAYCLEQKIRAEKLASVRTINKRKVA